MSCRVSRIGAPNWPSTLSQYFSPRTVSVCSHILPRSSPRRSLAYREEQNMVIGQATPFSKTKMLLTVNIKKLDPLLLFFLKTTFTLLIQHNLSKPNSIPTSRNLVFCRSYKNKVLNRFAFFP